jgi:5-methyltetrahydropteroyltriglutamate--homocysteine methyltransferase
VISVHTDVVGSLLRPPELLAARADFARGEIPAAALEQAENDAVDAAVRLQEEAGMEVVTDGEMRRLSFQAALPDAVDGFGEVPLEAYLWGEWRGAAGVGDRSTPRPPGLGVRAPLRRRRFATAAEFAYLRDRAAAIPKVTLASPSLYANLWSPEHSREVYPTLEGFLEDVAELLRAEVAELVRLGCAYVQLDAPHYPLLLDPATRGFYEGQGWDIDRWLARGIELDNHVIGGHPGVTFGFHLCRGNQGSRWLASGGYEPIARRVFAGVDAHRLLLEYDDDRSGSFQPLAEVPPGRIVVLGLVSTKTARLEAVDDLVARVHAAARHVGLDRLAVSTQCGFGTSVIGNALTEDAQRAKLELVAEVARRVWG